MIESGFLDSMSIPLAQIRDLILTISLILLSGIADSWGFIHASKMWDGGKLIWGEAAKSALGFGLGISMFWLAIRYLNEFRSIPAEVQTALWFVVTIVGVAIFSGNFAQWQVIDQVVALGVLAGICWLLLRTGG